MNNIRKIRQLYPPFLSNNIVLSLIILLAAVFRLSLLDVFPYGFTPDEASFGYDAYSILKTGRDQWGHTFPLVLKSFGDYKPPLYSYLSIPSVALMGLSKESVRLPNAIIGVAAVYATYLLAGELGKLSKLSNDKIRKLQLFSAFLLAVSPWHVMMSRGAFEANLTTFIMPLGIYLFLRSKDNNKLLILSALVFGLNLFSYHSARLVTPLVVITLVILYWRKFKFKDYASWSRNSSLFVFMIFLLLSFYTLTIGGAQRAKDLSIFNGAAQAAAGERLISLESGVPHLVAKAIHNKYVITAERFIENYTQYSSYNFLFNNGPAEETYGMIPGTGITYWFVFPLMIFSLVYLIRNPKDKNFWMILIWLIIAPIPAALTTGPGYAANRAVIMLPALQLFLGYGAVELFGRARSLLNTKLYKGVKIVFIIIVIVSVFNFLEKYFILSPFKVADGMLYGRLVVAQIFDEFVDNNEQVVVSTSLSEPHIYFAFANNIDPEIYQRYSKKWNLQEYNVDWVDQIPEYKLDRFIFKNIKWNTDSVVYSNFIGLPHDFPNGVIPNHVIYYPNLDEAVYLVNENINVYAYKDNK